ncbi:family 10 glycosylhydrolase [Listeria portnoyi]|uniref:family 10 glycosylhydrolase n=1 Tax=Listeria portnoyi TaxID=2713504 RepID=UPI0031B5E1F7
MASESAFRAQYKTVLDDFEMWNMNAVIFQVRPLLDAYYPSKINPWSEFIASGVQGANPGYDPLRHHGRGNAQTRHGTRRDF